MTQRTIDIINIDADNCVIKCVFVFVQQTNKISQIDLKTIKQNNTLKTKTYKVNASKHQLTLVLIIKT